MEYTYTCCNKTIIFNGLKKSYNRKVKENRPCNTCKNLKKINDTFQINGRKYIKKICLKCNIEKNVRYDQPSSQLENYFCNKCHRSNRDDVHYLCNHELYTKWGCMKQRCYRKKNDNYKYYGGKGIKICDEWKNDFLNFFEWSIKNGWNTKLEIDRIDSNKNYCPDNCRFITKRENILRTFEK